MHGLAAAAVFILLTTLGSLLIPIESASAATVFSETFGGYTNFPDQFPAGDPINFGEPLVSEGADNNWYGARFEQPDGAINPDPIQDIRLDIGVQQIAGGTGTGPVGRVGDDAGMLFRVDLTNAISASLTFDWRMFSAGSTDKLVVGYHVGDDLGFGPSTPVIDFVAAQGGQANAVAWWANEWTQLLRDNQGNAWSTQSNLALATGDVVWVAFWVDNGDGDFAKIDNLVVNATPIPEPNTALLVGVGLAGLAFRHRFVS